MDIKTALDSLDPTNDEHWTTDGMPRVDLISSLTGAAVTRKQITDVAPDLTRTKLRAAGDVEAPTQENYSQENYSQTTASVADVPGSEQPMDGQGHDVAERREVQKEPFDVSYVEPVDDVVGMTPAQVMASIPLIDRALAELERQSCELARRKQAVELKLRDLGARSAILYRQRGMMTRGSQNSDQAQNVRSYLETQQKIRAERAAAAQRFIAAGTTAKDVAAQLGGPSRLDQVLSAKRPAPDAKRPQCPMRGSG